MSIILPVKQSKQIRVYDWLASCDVAMQFCDSCCQISTTCFVS